jgi:hypothetical protein
LALYPPNWDFEPINGVVEDLESITVARIYDWKRAVAGSYDPMGYKNIPSDKADEGGRFDATSASVYPYCYFGLGDDAIAVGLWEVVLNKARPEAFASTMRLPEAEVRGLAFRLAANSHVCPLLILRDAQTCSAIGAPVELCFDDDYLITREWARFIRAKFPHVHGIRYLSRRYGLNGMNIVTFGDRCRNPRSYEPSGAEFKYCEAAGGLVIRTIGLRTGVDIVP